MTNKELEARLIKFAVIVVELIKALPEDRVTNHLTGQLLRSATSPALNYGEALGGESTKDLIHKIGIVLKELRESLNCLRILSGANYISENNSVIKECNELVSIFVKSVETSKRNLQNENRKSQIVNQESQIK
jgi:four helix bundle protein